MQKDLNLRAKAIKWLDKTMETNLQDSRLDNEFLGMTQKNTSSKRNNRHIRLSKYEKPVCSKDTINRVKKQTTELEKRLASHKSDKAQLYKIYRYQNV
jgi:hypothetical protein